MFSALIKKTADPFSNYIEDVEGLEQKYLRFLEKISIPLAVAGKTQFNGRAQQRGERQCVAFYPPFWYADMLGITDPKAVKEIAMANLILYHHATLIDDALDDQGVNRNQYSKLSKILLEKALGIFSQFASRQQIDEYFEEFAGEYKKAEAYLRRHHDIILPYNDTDFEMMGKKAALVKMSLRVLTSQQQPDFLEYIENATDKASTALQLMDDIQDWREDLDGGLYTYPVLLALHGQDALQNYNGELQSKVRRNIFLGGIAELVLGESNRYLSLSRNMFAGVGGSTWRNFLYYTSQQNSSLIEEMQLKKQTVGDGKPESDDLACDLERLVKITLQST